MKDKVSVNRQAYASLEALEKYSNYQLYSIERYLFSKYYKPGESVLDLACGGGRTTVRLHESGMKVKGVDLSEPLIKMAKIRFPYLQFEVGSYTNIIEADESADHVLISHNGIDYAYPEKERINAIMESARVLKKGGTLILSSHNIKSLHLSPIYFLHPLRILWKIRNSFNAFKEKGYILDLGMHTFFASQSYVKSQVEKSGLKCIEIAGLRASKNKMFNYFISPYIHYVFRKV